MEGKSVDDGGTVAVKMDEMESESVASASAALPPPEDEEEEGAEPKPFNVGDVVMCEWDGSLWEAKVLEVSQRSIKRKAVLFYRVQLLTNKARRGCFPGEWFDPSKIRRRTAKALAELQAQADASVAAATQQLKQKEQNFIKAVEEKATTGQALPTTWEMIQAAMKAINDKTGYTIEALTEWIEANFHVNPTRVRGQVSHTLSRAVAQGKLIRPFQGIYKPLTKRDRERLSFSSPGSSFLDLPKISISPPSADLVPNMPLNEPPKSAELSKMDSCSSSVSIADGESGATPARAPGASTSAPRTGGGKQLLFNGQALPPPVPSLIDVKLKILKKDDKDKNAVQHPEESEYLTYFIKQQQEGGIRVPSPVPILSKPDGSNPAVGQKRLIDLMHSPNLEHLEEGMSKRPCLPSDDGLSHHDSDAESSTGPLSRRDAMERKKKEREMYAAQMKEKAAQEAEVQRKKSEYSKRYREEMRRIQHQMNEARRQQVDSAETIQSLLLEKKKLESPLWRELDKKPEKHIVRRAKPGKEEAKDDLEVLAAYKAQNPIPPPLTSESLDQPDPAAAATSDLPAQDELPAPRPVALSPPSAVGDLLVVWDFVRQHAGVLGLKSFTLWQLATAVHDLEKTSCKKTSLLFLEKLVLNFLRAALGREAAGGEPLETEEHVEAAHIGSHRHVMMELKKRWANLLNPLTFPEVLRRHLALHMDQRIAEAAELNVLCAETTGLPPDGLITGLELEDESLAATRAMKGTPFRELTPTQVVALLRILCDELLDSQPVQTAMNQQQERLMACGVTRDEADRECKRLDRKLKRLTASKDKDKAKETDKDKDKETDDGHDEKSKEVEEEPDGVKQKKEQVDAEIRKVQAEMKVSAEALAKAQKAFDEAERALGTVKREPLGEDRHHNHYYFFSDEPGLGLLVHQRAQSSGLWGVYAERGEVDKLMKSLLKLGRREGKLLKALEGIYSLLEQGLGWEPPAKEGQTTGDKENQESSGAAAAAAAPAVEAPPAPAPVEHLRKSTRHIKACKRYDAGGQNQMSEAPAPRARGSSSRSSGSGIATAATAAATTTAAASAEEKRRARIPYAPMRESWRMTFDDASVPIACLKNELMAVEEEVVNVIRYSSLALMCQKATPQIRETWRNRLTATTDPMQLVDLLLELEEFCSEAMIISKEPAESLRIWRMLRDSGGVMPMHEEGAADEDEDDEDEEGDGANRSTNKGSSSDDEDDEEREDRDEEDDDDGEEEEEGKSQASKDKEEPMEVEQGEAVKHKPPSRKRKRGRPRKVREERDEEDNGSDDAGKKEEDDEECNKVDLDREMAVVGGPITTAGRAVWRAEVVESKTTAGLAFCLFAFVSQATSLMPSLRDRVASIQKKEEEVCNLMSSDIPEEGGQLPPIPTWETLQVVWARFPRAAKGSAFWPAMVHMPYNPAVEKKLRKKARKIVRFMGEVQLYHMPSAPTHLLDFKDYQGDLSVQVTKMTKSMDRALKVGDQLWERWTNSPEGQAKLAKLKEDEADVGGDDTSATDTDDDRKQGEE